jgi:hypothetical protein
MGINIDFMLPQCQAERTSPVLAYLAGVKDTLVVRDNGEGVEGVSSETKEEDGTKSARTGGRNWVLNFDSRDPGAEAFGP